VQHARIGDGRDRDCVGDAVGVVGDGGAGRTGGLESAGVVVKGGGIAGWRMRMLGELPWWMRLRMLIRNVRA